VLVVGVAVPPVQEGEARSPCGGAAGVNFTDALARCDRLPGDPMTHLPAPAPLDARRSVRLDGRADVELLAEAAAALLRSSISGR
jgi:hypothetical protein